MEAVSILVVEDSPEVQLVVRAALGQKYKVHCVSTVAETRKELNSGTYHLIILDIGLPDGDGLKLCAEIKANPLLSEIPVVFLTGKNEISYKVMGFSIGAEDYIVKPLEPLEFSARIDSKVRKLKEIEKNREYFRKGIFRVNTSTQKVFLVSGDAEADLSLTTNEFKLLLYFINHEDHVLSREQLLNHIWGRDTHVTDRTVDTHIYTLRKKLGTHASSIRAVARVGYRFSQPPIEHHV